MSVYDNKIVVSRKGLMGFVSQGFAGDKTISISNIYSVQIKQANPFINGFIQFGLAGSIEKQGGLIAAGNDKIP